MNIAICSMAEKDYYLGMGALINSLHDSGFTGRFFYGYRGEMPPFAKGKTRTEGQREVLTLPNGMKIIFIPLAVGIHFAQYKPDFMMELLNGEASDVDAIHYYDPDIVVKARWITMETWSQDGVAVCEDMTFSYFPRRHPRRLTWRNWIATHPELSIKTEYDRYFNTGFVSCPAKHKSILTLWKKISDDLRKDLNIPSDSIIYRDKRLPSWQENPYYTFDQDAFNIALMCHEVQANPVGPEGMDFGRYGYLLSHAAGATKPWRGGFIKRAFLGKVPTRAEKYWAMFINGPVLLYPTFKKYQVKLGLRLGAMIGKLLGGKDES